MIEPDTPPSLPVHNQRIQTLALVILTVFATTYMIYWLRPVLVPLVVALFVVSSINPILSTLEKSLRVSRILAAAITFLAGAALMTLLGISLWFSILDLGQNADAYRVRVKQLSGRVDDWLDRLTIQQKPAGPPPVESPPPAGPGGAAAEELPAEGFGDADEKRAALVDRFVSQGITVVSQSLLSLASTSLVVLIYVFFLLLGAPSGIATDPTFRKIDDQVRAYLILKTIISVFTGLAFGVALHLFGVPMAFTFGVMAFLLNFIPNIGPLIATMLPVPLILLDPHGSPGWMVTVISVTSLIQFISGNVVEPKLMGDSSDLHPVTILIALMFWGMLWGIVGMFLAMPITAGLKIVLEKYETTRPLSDWMAGRFRPQGVPAEFQTPSPVQPG